MVLQKGEDSITILGIKLVERTASSFTKVKKVE